MQFAQPSSGPIVIRATTATLVAGSITLADSVFGLNGVASETMVMVGLTTPAGTTISAQYAGFIQGNGTQVRVAGYNAAGTVINEGDVSDVTVFLISPAGFRTAVEGYDAALEVHQVQVAGSQADINVGVRANQFAAAPNSVGSGTTLGLQYQALFAGSSLQITPRAIDGATQAGDASLVNVFLLNTDFNVGHRLAPTGGGNERSGTVVDVTLDEGVGVITAASLGKGAFKDGTVVLTSVNAKAGTAMGVNYTPVIPSNGTNITLTARSTSLAAVTTDLSTLRVLIVEPPSPA